VHGGEALTGRVDEVAKTAETRAPRAVRHPGQHRGNVRASRPLTVSDPPVSRLKPVSSHDGWSMLAMGGGSGPGAATTDQVSFSLTACQLRVPSHPLMESSPSRR